MRTLCVYRVKGTLDIGNDHSTDNGVNNSSLSDSKLIDVAAVNFRLIFADTLALAWNFGLNCVSFGGNFGLSCDMGYNFGLSCASFEETLW